MTKFGVSMSAFVLVALVVAAAPITWAVKTMTDSNDADSDGLVSVEGKVTAYVMDDDDFENETHDDDNETYDHDQEYDHDNETCDHDESHDNDTGDADDDLEDIEDAIIFSHSDDELEHKHHEKVITAFVIDNETVVTCGPWWYWAVQNPNITDTVHIGDIVNVTGEMEDEDGMQVLCAWKIVNLTTGNELTIKEEGRPPWAGGPKALVLVPWPSEEDE